MQLATRRVYDAFRDVAAARVAGPVLPAEVVVSARDAEAEFAAVVLADVIRAS